MAQIDFFPQLLQLWATDIFAQLEAETPWSAKITTDCRVNAVYGDPGLIYQVTFGGYNNLPLSTGTESRVSRRPTIAWTESVLISALRDTVTAVTKQQYNFCIVQRYPSGAVGIKPHRDKEMVAGSTIAGLSFER